MAQNLSPMMRQYLEEKENYKDCLLFYRVGDFYEMFFEDAKTASKELDLVLTGKDCGLEERAPMCGVPFHAVDTYVNKLIHKGFKVAICEQMEDPAQAKGLVKRDVIRVITPGTVIEDKMLSGEENNYIVSIFYLDGKIGLAFADVSTGLFCVEEFSDKTSDSDLLDELTRLHPTEILSNNDLFLNNTMYQPISSSFYIQHYNDSFYEYGSAVRILLDHFHVNSLSSYGCDELKFATCAAGALLQYLEDTQKNSLNHIRKIQVVNHSAYMMLDSSTRRNLELTAPLRFDGSKRNTLLFLLNHTKTAMGARLLHEWVGRPLQNIDDIHDRQDAVGCFFDDLMARSSMQNMLTGVYDIERLCSKIVYQTINARDCISLKNTLTQIPYISELLKSMNSKELMDISENLNPMVEYQHLLDQAIIDDPPSTIKDGGIIKQGYNGEVDELRELKSNSKNLLNDLEEREKEETGIKNLKIGYNRVFGYYFEVTRSYYELIPERYIRKQTLANAERFITQDLKELEDKILGADEKLLSLELKLFGEIREKLLEAIDILQNNGYLLAKLDCYQSMAEAAAVNHYVRPVISDKTNTIHIVKGRHPVVEKALNNDFVSNDVLLDNDENQLLIITGPNMAGKSTYMRQIALITLLTHIGSFVPAEEAEVCLVDRIFTRIGASDDLATGQSTFMVEMTEMANIINNATNKSLLILDEIGRGTSTFDGLSIAWSILEHIADKSNCGAKTLFSTHYHELTELEGKIPGVKNYQVSVKEYGDDIIFLRKINRGSADKSFGIQVAKLAGLPDEIIDKAKTILTDLETADINHKDNIRDDVVVQCSLFDINDTSTLTRMLQEIDPDALSPKEALEQLYALKNIAENGDKQ